MLKIKDAEKIKITSIKYRGAIVHFKYEEEYYFIQNCEVEYTPVIRLYKGRNKYKSELIKSNYGMSLNLIKYINNKKVLKFIDKENFVNELCRKGLVEKIEE